MLDLYAKTGLPQNAALADRLGHVGTVQVNAYLAQALVKPAADLANRPSKKLRAQLVALGQELSGNAPPDTQRLELCTQAVELLHAGSLIVDDIQDGSSVRRGGDAIHKVYGVPSALCAGNWLYFWPLRLIRELKLPAAEEHRAFKIYHDALERAHYGQALDLKLRFDEVPLADRGDLARATAALKTGSITGLAMALGAILNGVSDEDLSAIESFGSRFGVSLQQLDDLSDLVGKKCPQKKREDLEQRRLNGVWTMADRLGESLAFGLSIDRADNNDSDDRLDRWLKASDFVERARRSIADDLEQAAQEMAAQLKTKAIGQVMIRIKQLQEVLLNVYI